jgi:mevalonate kinase
MQTIDYFYAHGKLLLTGEYLVLDGAPALAIPTQKGQWLQVSSKVNNHPYIHWKSYRADGSLWLDLQMDPNHWEVRHTNEREAANRLVEIFKAIQSFQPEAFSLHHNLQFTTHLEFPNEWGLGSSSTLIANLAQWAAINPYTLLEATFGGSGYDIACATAKGPIQYRRKGYQPIIDPVTFDPSFAQQLAFLYLGRKQNSREGIARYREKKQNLPLPDLIQQLEQINQHWLSATQLDEFEAVIQEHETLIAAIIDLPPVRERLFPDYEGQIKSLGAWGGDFTLVTAPNGIAEAQKYFQNKGLSILIPFEEMI